MNKMPNLKKVISGFIVTIVVIVCAFIILPRVLAQKDGGDYVRGVSGKKCYTIKNYPKNIKYFIYYNSEEECLADLNRATTTRPEDR